MVEDLRAYWKWVHYLWLIFRNSPLKSIVYIKS